MTARLRIREIFGLDPLMPALRQCYIAFAGDDHSPPDRWGLSSLRILRPAVSLSAWLGRHRADRRAPVFNLFNRNPQPRHLGYSVRVTDCRDYRGRQLTYDAHNGTDFVIPVGTRVVAPAAGVVRAVRTDMQYGGLKVSVDHGGGLLTVANHLSRALVRVGQRVARAQVVGLSGMSGLDGVLLFPWLAPHLHFTVILDGAAVDPFARPSEQPLWRSGNAPLPADPRNIDAPELAPSRYSAERVAAAIAACHNDELRAHLERIEDFGHRVAELALHRVYFNHSFSELPPLVDSPHPREPCLDLPLHADDVSGIVFIDDGRFVATRQLGSWSSQPRRPIME